jgi:hypothetical protein
LVSQSLHWLKNVESKSTRRAHYYNLSMMDPKLQADYGATT